MKMLIFICDDVQQDRMRLVHSVRRYCESMESGYAVSNVQIKEFGKPDDLLRAYRTENQIPDLIFLDIYMQGKDGMDTARMLRKWGCQAGIVFVTTSDEHAIDSYDVDALYYLKKPYTKERFTAAMDKCRSIFLQKAASFTVSINRKKYTVPYHDIVYFETSGHTVAVHRCAQEPLSFYASMKSIVEMVKDYPGFVTVGKSYIVNMNYIERFHDGILDLKDGTMIPVPVRSVKDVSMALEGFGK